MLILLQLSAVCLNVAIFAILSCTDYSKVCERIVIPFHIQTRRREKFQGRYYVFFYLLIILGPCVISHIVANSTIQLVTAKHCNKNTGVIQICKLKPSVWPLYFFEDYFYLIISLWFLTNKFLNLEL